MVILIIWIAAGLQKMLTIKSTRTIDCLLSLSKRNKWVRILVRVCDESYCCSYDVPRASYSIVPVLRANRQYCDTCAKSDIIPQNCRRIAADSSQMYQGWDCKRFQEIHPVSFVHNLYCLSTIENLIYIFNIYCIVILPPEEVAFPRIIYNYG